jgi:hypothetical protein
MEQTSMKNLDEVVLDALALHASYTLPTLQFPPSKKRLVVGSGNALPTGKVLFQGENCVFADEGQYLVALARQPDIDSAVVISASGGKDAPKIVGELMERKLPACLLTCNGSSPAANLLREYNKDGVFETRRNEEPITYNTSSYLGMILARTKENPDLIRQHLVKRVRPRLRNLPRYAAYFLILKPDFDAVREMFVTKFDELFGPRLLGRCYTTRQILHAKTVVPWEKELFVTFGCRNSQFGLARLDVPLPKSASFAALVATGYYVIGHIQSQFPAWFKRQADAYKEYQQCLFDWQKKGRLFR